MKSFLEGRQVVARSHAQIDRSSGNLPSFSEPAADSTVPKLSGYVPPVTREHGEKKIETVEVSGIIQKIIVTCGCGERIEVRCDY